MESQDHRDSPWEQRAVDKVSVCLAGLAAEAVGGQRGQGEEEGGNHGEGTRGTRQEGQVKGVHPPAGLP